MNEIYLKLFPNNFNPDEIKNKAQWIKNNKDEGRLNEYR